MVHIKFPATFIILRVISNEENIMPLHFFPQGLRVNYVHYIDALNIFVKPRINRVRNEKPYFFQQVSVPSHEALSRMISGTFS